MSLIYIGNKNSYAMPKTVTLRNTYSASELAGFLLPGYPTSRKSWYELVGREKWEVVEVPGKGPGGKRREYRPPESVIALIEQRLQGTLPYSREEPAPGTATPHAAHDPARPLYTYRGEPDFGVLEAEPGTSALVARCIVAAEKLLGDAYTRQQTVTLAIDTWGALRRMFYGREAENIQAIADADLELLTRFVFNTKRAVNPPGK